MPDYQYLFTPIQMGNTTVKNRICCSAHADALAEDGMPGSRQRRYYEEKARGGVGFMMCFGSASVHHSSPARDWNGVELFEDRVIPYLQNFSETMHQYEVPVVCQITHKGRRGRSIDLWNRMYAPSDLREPNHREIPHPLEKEMIEAIIEAFAQAAGRLQEGGFDGCEIMASHGHLIDQFWSRNSNIREDEYGDTLENRLRFCIRVIEAIRHRVGRDFIVGIRLTGDDFVENGLDNPTMQEICRYLNGLKQLDYFNVIGASAETYVGESAAVPNMSYKLGCYTYLAASIRKVVDVPVIATGRIVDPVQADQILTEGQADLCIMNRALIADPHMPHKAQTGHLDSIRQCMGYNEGCIDRIYTGRGVTCVQNPIIGREAQWAKLPSSPQRKKVVIVGGGPSGLEAARVCALCGHHTVLFEQNGELGGQTLIAKLAPGRQDYDGATRWSSLQCQKLGVDIRLHTKADVETIVAESPDVVLIATGATPRYPSIEGTRSRPVVSAWDVLQGKVDIGEAILVIDEEYGHQGPGAAEFLLDRGKEVDILTSQEAIGTFLGATNRPQVLARLFKKGIQIFPHLEAQSFQDGSLLAKNIWSGDINEVGPYDGYVYAYGGKSVDNLSTDLKTKGLQVEVIGDAFAPRSLQHAIIEGHQYARALGSPSERKGPQVEAVSHLIKSPQVEVAFHN